MKMRLNKRLNKIGERFQYFMDYVELGDKVTLLLFVLFTLIWVNSLLLQPHFVYVDGRNYPFGFIRRIARNTSIVFLKITVCKNIFEEFEC